MSRRRRIVIIAALACVPLALFGMGYGADFRFNLTPSYPLGLWRIKTLNRDVRVGDRVFICPPVTETFRQARERGYVRRGLCPGLLSPLIKTVVALPGQSVEIGAYVAINGLALPLSAVQPRDGSGQELTPYPGGVVPSYTLFLFSTFRGSYDSRYFGPIPAAGVLGLAKPVFTFTP
ncbi:conjugative transfer signal peptidase TraF [Labrenzia sp. R4_2]|uniref:conjugative transfer signal peptidase TraF n=1 Tax=Stappiaceae TaxID=2821832 RepID=UPI001ADADCDE|nr:conjugative transfer signal peptidase TraF [Roseibium sp. Sym1]MBO9422582.1 conjugative transfer signal peptidase TraF [Labrenzia sp. R4_2]